MVAVCGRIAELLSWMRYHNDKQLLLIANLVDAQTHTNSAPSIAYEKRSSTTAYRLQVRRDVDRVRLFVRRGYDWTGRYR
jgi:hypothetical protein